MKMKWMAAGLTGMVLLTGFNIAYGAQTIRLIINGNDVKSDVQPIVKNGHTYVPLRVVSDYLNEDIDWNQQSKTVTVHPDIWGQNLVQEGISRMNWVYARDTVIRFLMAFDERDQSGKKLVSPNFDTNLLGPEVVIPLVGVGSDEGKMVDFQFMDAKTDRSSNTMTIRVKLWFWPFYTEEREEQVWDFTLDLAHFSDEYNSYPQITKVWLVDKTAIDSHTVFPGLTFSGQ